MRVSPSGLAVAGVSVAAVVVPPLWFGWRGAPKAPSSEDEPPSSFSQIDWDAPLASPEVEARVSRVFFAGYAAACAFSLAGGVAFGIKSFDTTAAEEALAKVGEKPSPQVEAHAMRSAVRALGWGTVLAVGTAAVSVLTVRYALGLESAAEFGAAADATLQPVNRALLQQGRWVHVRAGEMERAGSAIGRWLGAPVYQPENGSDGGGGSSGEESL